MDFYRVVVDSFGLRESPRKVQLYCGDTQEYLMLDLVTSYPLDRLQENYRLKFEDKFRTYTMILYGMVARSKYIYVLINEETYNQYCVVSVDSYY